MVTVAYAVFLDDSTRKSVPGHLHFTIPSFPDEMQVDLSEHLPFTDLVSRRNVFPFLIHPFQIDCADLSVYHWCQIRYML